MQKTWSEDKLEANNYREKEREREPNNNRKKERDRTRQQQKKTKNRKKEKYKRMKEIEKDTIEGTIKFLFTKCSQSMRRRRRTGRRRFNRDIRCKVFISSFLSNAPYFFLINFYQSVRMFLSVIYLPTTSYHFCIQTQLPGLVCT